MPVQSCVLFWDSRYYLAKPKVELEFKCGKRFRLHISSNETSSSSGLSDFKNSHFEILFLKAYSFQNSEGMAGEKE